MMDKHIEERTDAEIMRQLGRRLAALRKSAGLTQGDAADRAGLDRSTVSRAEQG
ncbi:MAG: helix-turn-helix domain-containing protein, partial [Longimicrobiales bacterium]